MDAISSPRGREKRTLMPVFKEEQILFYHIPKCGGSRIEEAFGLRHPAKLFYADCDYLVHDGVSFAPQHYTPAVIERYYPEYAGFKSFCMIRNPLERVISEYFWFHRDFKKQTIKRFRENRFIDWLREEVSQLNRDHFLPQRCWASGADQIFPLHEMNRAFDWIEKETGIKPNLDTHHTKRNALNTAAIAASLSEQATKAIHQIYKDDFLLWDHFKS